MALQKVDKLKVYRAYKYPSLFKYVTLSLGFSEQKAYGLITVSRAARQFSKLAQALATNRITVAKAKRIAPVLNESNQDEWILKAHNNTHRRLEELVAGENPELICEKESVRPISANHYELKVIITREEFNHLKRAQDLLCQKQKKHVSAKNTVMATTREYIKRNDPVVKAARAMLKNGRVKIADCKPNHEKSLCTCIADENPPQNPTEPSQEPGDSPQKVTGFRSRIPIPSLVFHQVQLRDKGRCQKTLPNGEPCHESRWTNLHHIIPVAAGGPNRPENLTTLCHGHHRIEHT